MAGISGPVVATSATGAQLAIGPPGPQGLQGPTGPAGPAGANGAGFNPWTRYNFTGSGGAQASGTALSNTTSALQILVDTTGGQVIVPAMPVPVDGIPITLKDPNGNWAVTPPKFGGLAGWKVELPSAPGTYSAPAAQVALWPQPGALITFIPDAVQQIFLLG